MKKQNGMAGMFNPSKIMDRFFKKVDDKVVWDLMSGRIGIRNSQGEITTLETSQDGDETIHEVSVNLMDQFGMPVPAFAQNTPVADVKVGDMIYGARDVTGWVVEIKKSTFTILKPSGVRTTWQAPKVKMMGMEGLNGVMVLRSLLNMMPGDGQSGLQGIQGMLMPMMMMGGDIDLDSMMPMMLMMQMGNGVSDAEGNANPMAAMGGMGGNMMQTMMMMNMMKGGDNPMSSMFGSKDKNFFDQDSH